MVVGAYALGNKGTTGGIGEEENDDDDLLGGTVAVHLGGGEELDQGGTPIDADEALSHADPGPGQVVGGQPPLVGSGVVLVSGSTPASTEQVRVLQVTISFLGTVEGAGRVTGGTGLRVVVTPGPIMPQPLRNSATMGHLLKGRISSRSPTTASSSSSSSTWASASASAPAVLPDLIADPLWWAARCHWTVVWTKGHSVNRGAESSARNARRLIHAVCPEGSSVIAPLLPGHRQGADFEEADAVGAAGEQAGYPEPLRNLSPDVFPSVLILPPIGLPRLSKERRTQGDRTVSGEVGGGGCQGDGGGGGD